MKYMMLELYHRSQDIGPTRRIGVSTQMTSSGAVVWCQPVLVPSHGLHAPHPRIDGDSPCRLVLYERARGKMGRAYCTVVLAAIRALEVQRQHLPVLHRLGHS